MPCTGDPDNSNSQVSMLKRDSTRSTEDQHLKCTQPSPLRGSNRAVHPSRGGLLGSKIHLIQKKII